MSEALPNEDESFRCFHCGDVFVGVDAENHFGRWEGAEPACKIKAPGEYALLQALRNAEDELNRHRAEDTDVLRAMHHMISDHQVALRREEEKGYERGLRDARLQSETGCARCKEHEQFRHQHRDCDKAGIALHRIKLGPPATMNNDEVAAWAASIAAEALRPPSALKAEAPRGIVGTDCVYGNPTCPRCHQTMPAGDAVHTDYCPAQKAEAPRETGVLPPFAWIACVNDLDGGGKVELGFVTLEQAQAAHEYLVASAQKTGADDPFSDLPVEQA